MGRSDSFSNAQVLAPFAQVNGNTFFAYCAANTGASIGISHFRTLGNNLFGLEDISAAVTLMTTTWW